MWRMAVPSPGPPSRGGVVFLAVHLRHLSRRASVPPGDAKSAFSAPVEPETAGAWQTHLAGWSVNVVLGDFVVRRRGGDLVD